RRAARTLDRDRSQDAAPAARATPVRSRGASGLDTRAVEHLPGRRGRAFAAHRPVDRRLGCRRAADAGRGQMTLTVAGLDALSAPQARSALSACCGSATWLTAMESRRPFRTADALFRAGDEAWRELEPADWLEAFTHHPRIGERRAAAAVDA